MNLLRINPFLRFLAPFILGILTSHFICTDQEVLNIVEVIALLVLILGAWWSNYSVKLIPRLVFGISLVIVFWSLGSTNYLVIQSQKTERSQLTQSTIDENAGFIFKVLESPVAKNNYYQSSVELYDSLQSVSKGIAYFKDSISVVKQGDWIWTNQKPILFQQPQNPGQFDYKSFMEAKGYHFSAFINDFRVLDTGNSVGFLSFFENIQRQWVNIFEQYLKGEELAIASALVLGDKSHLDAEMREAYAQAGAMHVLAVSGLHVGLVYLFLNFVLQFLNGTRNSRILKTILIVIAILFYAGITGFSPSVTRAAIMFSLFALGKVLRRGSSIYNIIFACAFFMLLYDPQLLFNVSFQLSFVAVIGIIYLFPKLFELWVPNNAIIQYFWGLVCLSVSAQLATFPLAMYYFGLFPTWFLLTNLVVVPAAFVELAGGFLLIISHYIFDMGIYVGQAYEMLINWVNQIIIWINGMPPGAVRANLDLIATLFIYGSLVFWLALLEFPKVSVLRCAQITTLAFLGYVCSTHLSKIRTSGILVYANKSHVVELFSGGVARVWIDSTRTDYSKTYKYLLQPSWKVRGISNYAVEFIEMDKLKSLEFNMGNSPTVVFNCEHLDSQKTNQILVAHLSHSNCFNGVDSSLIWFINYQGFYLQTLSFKK